MSARAALAGAGLLLATTAVAQITVERPKRHAGEAEWGYTRPTGPDHWAERSRAYRVCATGRKESPIDLRRPIRAELDPLATVYRRQRAQVRDNGHTVEVSAEPGQTLRLHGRTYTLRQIHFRHPSEHLLDGRRFPLEIHLVHAREDGDTGVIAVMGEFGAEHAGLAPVFAAMRKGGGTVAAFDPGAILPPDRSYLRYEGSLTTPPCTENVDWFVVRTPIEVSREQVARFTAVHPANARPIQPARRCFVSARENDHALHPRSRARPPSGHAGAGRPPLPRRAVPLERAGQVRRLGDDGRVHHSGGHAVPAAVGAGVGLPGGGRRVAAVRRAGFAAGGARAGRVHGCDHVSVPRILDLPARGRPGAADKLLQEPEHRGRLAARRRVRARRAQRRNALVARQAKRENIFVTGPSNVVDNTAESRFELREGGGLSIAAYPGTIDVRSAMAQRSLRLAAVGT